ncbi:MAG TPA: L-seryl-tRNA(Sec) selenium transferase [Paenalcaligenes sp.]|nr:L-seryl-tRNA(Sec) selenium transferase [Paenalcaligenes sp.]
MTENKNASNLYRPVSSLASLPSVDRLLGLPAVQSWVSKHGQTIVVRAIRETLAERRARFHKAGLYQSDLEPEGLLPDLQSALERLLKPSLSAVINLSGTVLHTNLGRALLPERAVTAVVNAMRHSVNLEYDLSSGRRGDRDELIKERICALTGAEDATVVNNNAAAVFLMLNTLAFRRQVVVSRGELVEIGGSFRIPDIMSRAGVRLREVGTTNRTHLHDYEHAIHDRTGMLMKVHCSNYEIQGFTHEVPLNELASLGAQHDIPTTVDLGSGTLIDMQAYGLPAETTVQQSIRQGAQVVTFSGDKLLGGPQSGILVGDADSIQAIKKNPLKRMLRVDKLTLAALDAVLSLYEQPELLAEQLTTLRFFTRPLEEIKALAVQWQAVFQQWVGEQFEIEAVPMHSQIGSGALPVDALPSYGLRFVYRGSGRSNSAIIKLEERLRQLPTPIVGRIHQQNLFLDFRCLSAADEEKLHFNFYRKQ